MQPAPDPRRRSWVPSIAGVVTVAVVVGASIALAAADPETSREEPPPLLAAAGPSSDVRTGIVQRGREVVIYVRGLGPGAPPGVTFGVEVGWRDAAGRLTPGVFANETEGLADAPGFHARQASETFDGARVSPEFGYYVGPAVTIERTAAGRAPLVAHQRAWDLRPGVVLFWFTPGELAFHGLGQSTITAYDAAGEELPAGNPGLGHG